VEEARQYSVVIVVKLFLTAVFALIGLWLWGMGKRWSADDEIPKEWVESVDPQPVGRDDPHFGKVVVWQKIMAFLAWFFGGLCFVSIGFELTGNL
jgi:hypothetical protein